MKKYQDIEAAELHALLDTQQIYLIDVRNDDEVARGVIPGATYITLSSIPSVNFSQLENQTLILLGNGTCNIWVAYRSTEGWQTSMLGPRAEGSLLLAGRGSLYEG